MGPEILELPARRALYQKIRERPGLHQRELERATGLAPGQIDHHLHVLEGEGLVASRREANRVRYFASDVPPRDKDLLGLLRTRPARRAVVFLLEHPGSSLSQVAEAIELAVSSTHTHVSRLVDGGVVEKAREGNRVALRVADENACLRVLVAYRPSFVDRALDRFLDTFGSLDREALR